MSLYVDRNNPNGAGSSPQQGESSQYGGGLQARNPEGNSFMSNPKPGLTKPEQTQDHDYRDDLRSLLDKAHTDRGLTRYRLCKLMGIDSGTLSNVLAKRRHFSLEKLEQILNLLGYRLTFTRDESINPA